MSDKLQFVEFQSNRQQTKSVGLRLGLSIFNQADDKLKFVGLRLCSQLAIFIEEERLGAVFRTKLLRITSDSTLFTHLFKAQNALEHPQDVGGLLALGTGDHYSKAVYQTKS